VYLHLPFEEYVEQDALGGTDKARLWLRREGWWWASPHNPYRGVRKSSPEQAFGTALHAMLLEGPHAYETRFCIKPEPADFPDALTSIEDVKKALREEKVHVSPTPKNAEEWYDVAELYLPDRPVWANVMADFKRRQIGRTAISAEEDFAIRAMRAIATDERPENAEMRELLSVGSQFPILRGLGDLHRRRRHPPPRALRQAAAPGHGRPEERRRVAGPAPGYDPRPAHQEDGLRRATGRLPHRPPGHEPHAAGGRAQPPWRHAGGAPASAGHRGVESDRTDGPGRWLWFQKPSAGGNAPILLPQREAWQGPYHIAGFRKRQAGLELYRRCMRETGPDKPWGRVEPVHWPDEGAEHRIFIDDRGWGPAEEAQGEAEHFGYQA
jgi:hypothetical protein